ncbi:1124_t:CDS:2, partial [Acaulospora colombiana]
MKTRLKALGDKKEALEKMGKLHNEAEYASICFEYTCGVTSAGQHNIKFVKSFVEDKGFKVKYGDTDSLYLVCPEEYFQECDIAYNNGNGISREDYWSQMVKISMEVMANLRNE